MPATRRGEGMTAAPTGPATNRDHPAMTSATHTQTSTKEAAADSSPQSPTACANRRRPQGPTAATRSGSARALTTTPPRRVSNPADKNNGPAKEPLDRPRSFRDDLRVHLVPPAAFEPATHV